MWYLSRSGCSFVERRRCAISLWVSVPLSRGEGLLLL